MTSLELRRLGIHQLLPNRDIGNGSVLIGRLSFEIKFNSFFQVRDGFFPCRPEAGDINIEALGDKKLVLPVNAIRHRFHESKILGILIRSKLWSDSPVPRKMKGRPDFLADGWQG